MQPNQQSQDNKGAWHVPEEKFLYQKTSNIFSLNLLYLELFEIIVTENEEYIQLEKLAEIATYNSTLLINKLAKHQLHARCSALSHANQCEYN